MFGSHLDQASGLRRLFARRSVRVLPIAGAPGDLQCASFVINLASALVQIGRHPLVLDALGGAIVDALGVVVDADLADLLDGRQSIHGVARSTPEGFDVMRADRGLPSFAASGGDHDALFSAFGQLAMPFDLVLVCAPPETIGELLGRASPYSPLILSTDGRSPTTPYAEIKRLSTRYGFERFQLAFYRVSSRGAAEQSHGRIAAAAGRFLGSAVEFAGAIERDSALDQVIEHAGATGASVFSLAPQSDAARSFAGIARASLGWALPEFAPTGPTIH